MKATITFLAFYFGLATARPQALQAPESNEVLTKADFVQKFKDHRVICSIGAGGWINSNGGSQEFSRELTCDVYKIKGNGPTYLDIICEDQEGGCNYCVNRGKIANRELEQWTCVPGKTQIGTQAPGEDKYTPAQEADKVPKKADKFIGPEFW